MEDLILAERVKFVKHYYTSMLLLSVQVIKPGSIGNP